MRAVACLLLLAFPAVLCLPLAAAEDAKPTQEAMQHFCGDFRITDDAHTVVNAVLKSDAAMFSCLSGPRYCFDDEIEWLRTVGEVVHLIPHRLGWFDALHFSSVVLNERPDLRDTMSDALFGRISAYEMTLWDFPRDTTLKNLRLLSRLPKFDNLGVRILTDHPDKQLLEATTQIRVHCDLAVCDLSGLATKGGRVAGTVVDSQGKSVEGATIVVRGRDGKPISHTNTTDMQGHFTIGDMPRVPYRVSAHHPSPWVASPGDPVASSDSANAEPGDSEVRIVLDVHK